MKLQTNVLLAGLLTYALQAGAEVLPLKIAPGLWEQTRTTIVNGQNFEAAMAKMQERMLANASPEEREILQQDMAKRGGKGGARAMECITPEAVAKGLDTEKIRRQLQNSSKNCEVRFLSATPKGGNFEMVCMLPNGGSQKGSGEFVLKSDKEWGFNAVSSGDVAGAPPGTPKMQATVEIKSVWKGSDCGSVRPAN